MTRRVPVDLDGGLTSKHSAKIEQKQNKNYRKNVEEKSGKCQKVCRCEEIVKKNLHRMKNRMLFCDILRL